EIEQQHHPAGLLAHLLQQCFAMLGIIWVEAEAEPVALQQIAYLVAARIPLRTDDSDHLDRRTVDLRPLAEQLRDQRVELLFPRLPRLGQVRVEVVEGHGLNDRVEGAGVAVGEEQKTTRAGMEAMCSGEQLDARQRRHPLIGNQESYLLSVITQPYQPAQGRRPGSRGEHPVVCSVPATQIAG